MTPEEALALHRYRKSKETTVAPSTTAADVGKSFGSRFLGGVADIFSGMGGASDPTMHMPGEFTQGTVVPGDPMTDAVAARGGGAGRDLAEAAVPGSTTYQAETEAGRWAGTMGDVASGVVLGPGGIVRKGAMAVAGGGMAEAGGHLAQKHAPGSPGWETAGRVGGMLLGGGLTAGKPNANTVMAAARATAKSAPSADLLRTTVDQMYDLFRRSGIRYDANTFQGLGQRIHTALFKEGHRPVDAPQAYKYASQLARDALSNPSPDFSDIERLSQVVGKLARNLRRQGDGTAADALYIVRGQLDDFGANAPLISSIPASQQAIKKWRGIARGLALRNIKAHRMSELLEDAATHKDGFIAGLQKEISAALTRKADKGLFNKSDRELLKAVRDGHRPASIMSKFGVDLNDPKFAQLIPSGMMAGLPTAASIAVGSPSALLPIVAAGTVATIGTAARSMKPGLAKRSAKQAAAAMRSPQYPQTLQKYQLEQNRRRMRQLLMGIPVTKELTDEEEN